MDYYFAVRHSGESRNPLLLQQDKSLDAGSKPVPDSDPGSGMTERTLDYQEEMFLTSGGEGV